MERQVFRAEMHRRREAQVEVLAQSQVGEHTHTEAGVPTVVLTHDGLFLHRAVIKFHWLWSHVLQTDILKVHAHEDAEMELAQVGIRPVLYGTRLSLPRRCEQAQ